MRTSSIGLRLGLIAMALMLAPSLVRAECRADSRAIDFGTSKSDETEVPDSGSRSVPLAGYLCRAGTDPNGPQIRVEFHRLSDGAASAFVQKRSSAGLTQVFGSPRVIENDVFKTYADLLRRFGGVTEEVLPPFLRIEAPRSAKASVDEGRSDIKGMRTLINIISGDSLYNLFYPAADEIEALRSRSLPPSLKYFYRQDQTDLGQHTDMLLWRSLGADDVKSFASNAQAFNRLLRRLRGKKHKPDLDTPTATPGMLKLLQHIAGDRWPNDFVIMYASVDADEMIRRSDNGDNDGCGDEMVGNLTFEIPYPNIILDSVLIENISNIAVKIDALHGSQSSVSTLRPLGSDSSRLTGASFDMSQTLAPGQKLLVLTRISFVPQLSDRSPVTDNVTDWSKLLRTSTQVQKKKGTGGLRANQASHAVPLLKTYLFGPELSVAGLTVNGARVDLEQRTANFSDLVMSREGMSCPYLLSWDATSRTWAEHGKVLDKAPTENREYSEVKLFPGFRSRFRIEEREPEIAFIKDVELVATLGSGVAITLEPKKVVTAAEREGEYLSLYWGQSAEFEFTLPRDIAEDQVVTSRFVVTGYYRRYSAMLARAGVVGSRILSPRPIAAPNP